MESIAILPDIKATILATVKANGVTASSEASQLAMEALTNYKLEILIKANIEAYGLNNVTNQLASLLIQPILTKTNGELVDGLVFDQMYMAKTFNMTAETDKVEAETYESADEVKSEKTNADEVKSEKTNADEVKAEKTESVEVKAEKTESVEVKAEKTNAADDIEEKTEAEKTNAVKFQWSDLVRATANTPVVPPSNSTFVTQEVEEKTAPIVRSTLNNERRKTVTSRMWAFANKFFLTEEKDAFLWEFDEEGYPIGYLWEGNMCKSYRNDQFSYSLDEDGKWHIFEDYYYTDKRNNESRGYREVSVDYFTWMITPPYKREGRCPAK